MSEIQTENPQSSDFARALNSMMDNIENVVVNFQKTLLIVLEKVEKLEKLEKKLSRTRMTSNEKRLYTEEIKQPINDATTSESHQESNGKHNETEMTENAETTLQQDETEISESAPAKGAKDLKKHGFPKGSVLSGVFGEVIKRISSKSNYLILAIVLAVFSVAIIKLYFMLFP